MYKYTVPLQLAKENKKFFFGKIKEGARAKDFEIAIEWLQNCGLITKVYCDKFKPESAVRTSMMDYQEQEWMVNIPLYTICNL